MNPREEPRFVRYALIAVAVAFLGVFIFLPLLEVFASALAAGIPAYLATFSNPDALAAIRLTLITASIAVPLNVAFGVAAAWSIAKFKFPGKNLLITLIDLPFSVSPVVAGLVYILLFGRQAILGNWLEAHGIHVVFAIPGIIIATIFVTFPFVARELIPTMQALGNDEEEAAATLGATSWQTFFFITIPNVRWALIYGIILCNARAMGEFGAVSVVSGHIVGLTNTMPLQVEVFFEDYNFVAAFTVASLLALLALATMIVKNIIEWRGRVRLPEPTLVPERAVA